MQNDIARAPDERRVANMMIVKHVVIYVSYCCLHGKQTRSTIANSNSVL